tara:strand:+ start:961 stop:1206 length:246 start_codon:yes stop_codon:yes gene_type:complete
MEYDTSSKHQIIVKNKTITEKINFKGEEITRERVIKDFKIPEIIVSDVAFQLQFGLKGGDKAYSRVGNQDIIYLDKNINLK